MNSLFSLHRYGASIAVFLFISGFAQAQISTSNTAPYNNPDHLINNILLGNGVEAFNVTYTGSPSAVGFFDATGTNLGLDSGIILSSGTIGHAVPNGNPSWATQGPGCNLGRPGDNDIRLVAQSVSGLIGPPAVNTVNDAAILEFDFLPASDTVQFRYIFASEEYPLASGCGYIKTAFNDAFGFFISGPGINGGQGFTNNAENIADVPGTPAPGWPITVSTIHSGQTACSGYGPTVSPLNPQFHVPNPVETHIEYNGYTTILTAKAAVIPCALYHIKLGIADGTDRLWDSGVLIEANSFVSERLAAVPAIDFGVNDSVLHEGCGSATITLERFCVIQNDTVLVTKTGVADASDYAFIPDTLFFPPFVQFQDVIVAAVSDATVEGLENLILEFEVLGPFEDVPVSVEVYIDDTEPITLNTSDTLTSCIDTAILIAPEVFGGYGLYNYAWSSGETDSAIWVAPATTTTYDVTVGDTCGILPVLAQIEVVVVDPPPLDLITNDITLDCSGDEIEIGGIPSGGHGFYQYSWSTGETDSSIVISPASTTTYTLTLSDTCGTTDVSGDITITAPELLDLTTTNDTVICDVGGAATLSAVGLGGSGMYGYNWVETGEDVSTISVSPTQSATYTVEVTDLECYQTVSNEIAVGVSFVEADFFLEYEQGGNFIVNFFNNSSSNANQFEWDFGDGAGVSSTLENPVNQFTDNGLDYIVTLVVRDQLGCTDTVARTVLPPMTIFFPNAFSPNGNGHNEFYGVYGHAVEEFSIRIFNRFGQEVFSASDIETLWDGTDKSGKLVPAGVYTYQSEFSGIGQEETVKQGSILVVR